MSITSPREYVNADFALKKRVNLSVCIYL